MHGSKRTGYLTNAFVSLQQIANQSAGDGAPADDNTAWIDPWVENEPDPHNDVVTKVTTRRAHLALYYRAVSAGHLAFDCCLHRRRSYLLQGKSFEYHVRVMCKLCALRH